MNLKYFAMKRMSSINQNIRHKLLPNFVNLGTVLRIALLVNGIALLCAVSQSISLDNLVDNLLHGSALLQPVLLSSLLVLYVLNPVLGRMQYLQGMASVLAVVAAVTVAIDLAGGDLFSATGEIGMFRYIRHALVSIAYA